MVLGILISYALWVCPKKISNNAFFLFSGLSFIPVTILIPFFLGFFGLSYFIYPLLSLPVALLTISSLFDSYRHVNKHRSTLYVNYGMPKNTCYFWQVVFREVAPNMQLLSRQSLSLCFAIFIAIDYFVGYWKGLGALALDFYSMTSFDTGAYVMLFVTIIVTGLIGAVQVMINDAVFKKVVEFRRHY